MGTFDPALRELLDDVHALLSAAMFGEEEIFTTLMREWDEDPDYDLSALLSAMTAYVVGMIRVLARRSGDDPEALFRRYLARTVAMDAGGEA